MPPTTVADGKQTLILDKQGAGIAKADLRALLPASKGAQDWNITLRAFGNTTFDYVRFSPDPNAPKSAAKMAASNAPPAAATTPAQPMPILLRIPLAKAGALKGNLQMDGKTTPVAVNVKQANGQAWAEVRLDIMARGVLTLTP